VGVSDEPPGVDPEKNRRILAERMGYPDGALSACIAIEDEFPRWIVYWTKGASPGKPAGFYAFRSGPWATQQHLYGRTPDELRKQISASDHRER
jgi:hypothetical protein